MLLSSYCYFLSSQRIDEDKLFNLFSLYGNIVRIKLLHNKPDHALVQMGDGFQAELAVHFLKVWFLIFLDTMFALKDCLFYWSHINLKFISASIHVHVQPLLSPSKITSGFPNPQFHAFILIWILLGPNFELILHQCPILVPRRGTQVAKHTFMVFEVEKRDFGELFLLLFWLSNTILWAVRKKFVTWKIRKKWRTLIRSLISFSQ